MEKTERIENTYGKLGTGVEIAEKERDDTDHKGFVS